MMGTRKGIGAVSVNRHQPANRQYSQRGKEQLPPVNS
jgi:hypothetical protein